jgi:hypothetical protein
MKPSTLVRRILPLAACLLLSACDQPPAREIAAAEAALAQARKDQADAYAPEQWKAAEAALGQARQKVDAKDYRGALSSAMDAGEKARSASAAVASAKLLVKGAAQMAQAEVQAALDEVATVREEAAKSKVPAEAFAVLDARAQEATDAVAGLTSHIEKDELLEAQKAGADLKARFGSLGADFRAALDTWLEEHPKGRRAVKKT